MARGLSITLSSGTAVAVAGTGLHGVIWVTVRNRGTGTAFLGGSDVTTVGYQLTTADTPLTLRVMSGESLYGCSTGTPVLDVLQMNETSSS